MKGRDVCYHHGGKTPRGVASPHYKDGSSTRWDEILPSDLVNAFLAAYNDPKLLSLRKDIAVTEAREMQLLAELTSDDSAATWSQLLDATDMFERAQISNSKKAQAGAFRNILALIKHGASNISKWKELREVQEHKRKLTETEWKSKTALARVLTMEQFASFLDAFKSAIFTNVSSRAEQQAVIDTVREMVLSSNILGEDDGEG